MLSKFVSTGDKIELRSIDKKWGDQLDNSQKVYSSDVHVVLSDDTMEIIMPMENTKLILLPVDSEYDLIIYGATGLYQCFARVIDRYKSNNVFLLLVELTSNLRKYQRREFYRFSCALEMCARNLEQEEVSAIEQQKPCALQPGLPLKRSIIVDISGGGFRFLSEQRYEPDSLVYCKYQLFTEEGRKEYEIVGKVLSVKESDNRPGTYEHRVQYYNLDTRTRENIIKFIFEEERNERKKERLM